MARIDTPDVSDDDFAMVNSATSDGPAVSFQTPELINRLQRSQQPGPSRINSDDDAAAVQSSGFLLDGSVSSILNPQTKDSNLTSYFGDVPGLKYGKSLYKKLSSKEDVLIAVMGYSYISQAGDF
jgi:hypothetical protein